MVGLLEAGDRIVRREAVEQPGRVRRREVESGLDQQGVDIREVPVRGRPRYERLGRDFLEAGFASLAR